MKLFSATLKSYLLIFNLLIVYNIDLNAQGANAVNYLQKAGDYAVIYNGRIEPIYNSIIFENTPYYVNSEFTDASVIFKNIYYPNQKARLDLYKEQLIILPPERKYGIIISSQSVDKVFIHNRTFVFLGSDNETSIRKGYYMQLLDGDIFQLFCKENHVLRQTLITYVFDQKINFFLLYNSRYYTVKSKASFSKLFPQYKKQINQHVKENKLNFRRNKEESLTSLAIYCEKLLTSTNK